MMRPHRRSLATETRAHQVIVSELEEFLRSTRIRRVHFAEFSIAPPMIAYVTNFPRLSIPLHGCHRMEVAHNGRSDRVFRIRDLVEKPKVNDAPSNLAIIGRYVLTPEIFDSLQTIDAGSGGELQLTDALKHLLRSRPIYAYRFEGTRYDAGDKLGFLKATVEFALRRPDLGSSFREYLKSLTL